MPVAAQDDEQREVVDTGTRAEEHSARVALEHY